MLFPGDIGRVKEILLSDNSMKDFCLPLDGATPLMYAAMSGRIDIAMLLVENHCDINKQDKISHWTALMQAIFHGYVAFVFIKNFYILELLQEPIFLYFVSKNVAASLHQNIACNFKNKHFDQDIYNIVL